MDREQKFIEALTNYPSAPAQNEAFVKQHVEEARLTARVATQMWAKGNKELAYNAMSYLIDIGDLAIVPLVEGPMRDDPKSAVQALDVITEAELALRDKIFRRVDRMLDDKRAVPPLPSAITESMEEKPQPRRVCDEAYVAMRRLVHFGEPRLSQHIDKKTFFSLSEAKRDAEIEYARKTHTWRRIMNPDDDEDDDTPPPSSGKPGRVQFGR